MIDKLEDAETFLEQLPGAVERRRLGQRLSQAVQKLRDVEYQAERMSALSQLAEVIGFGTTEDEREDRDDMLENAVGIGANLEASETDEDLRSAVDAYDHTLKPAIATLDRSLRNRWQRVVLETFQPLVGIGQLMNTMNVRNNLGERLAECGNKAKATTNVAKADELLQEVKALYAEYEILQKERFAEIGNDDVGEFINALSEKRATLEMVTPKVHEWLKSHGALGSLNITPG